MKKTLIFAVAVLSLMTTLAEPEVLDVTANHWFPLNWRVVITYTMTGDMTARLPIAAAMSPRAGSLM